MKKRHKDTQTQLPSPQVFDKEYILKSCIKMYVKTVPEKYSYPNEKGINPAFQRIEEAKKISENEKRIFTLRNDFILATGVKNANQEYGYHGLKDTFEEVNYKFINWKDRYGHPSLTGKEKQVFYAGILCQRKGFLQIFLSSGRYNRCGRKSEGVYPLTSEQTQIIEAYLAIKFLKAYGNQKVSFYDTTPEEDEKDSALFFTDKPFPNYKRPRIYDDKTITQAVKIAYQNTHYEAAQKYIKKKISSVKPKYSYEGENSINPGYQDISSVEKGLRNQDKRIWALRSDFILALGVKNAYEKKYNYKGFKNGFSEQLYPYIDWKDRYGHTSLTIPDGDGCAYYAGYICQKKGYLQVYLVSGRYERTDLNQKQTRILEAYIALQFFVTYGAQEIEFVVGNSDIPSFHATFFSNKTFKEDVQKRRYNLKSIKSILKNIPAPENELKPLENDERGLLPTILE